MGALGEDHYKQLKSAVDAWAAEVSEVRSVLSDKLKVEVNPTRPAFRLLRDRPVPPREASPGLNPQTVLDANTRAVEAEREKQRIESELVFAREQLMELSREVDEQRVRADEKAEQLEEMARALGRARLDLNEAVEHLREKEWALLQATSENSHLRGETDALAQPRLVCVEDYDAVVESHMAIRDEVAALQERVIQREHEIIVLRDELASARAELTVWESVGPASGSGIAKLAGVIAERSAALEELEEASRGQELLINALREELNAARSRLAQREYDDDSVMRALRSEVETLRAVSTERDFVVSHQAQTVESIVVSESALKTELDQARELCETLQARVQQAADEREGLAREMRLLRAKLAERESEVWRLRTTAPAAGGDQPGMAQLQAALASREAELSRARARIDFLKGQGRESAGLTAVAEVFSPDAPPVTQALVPKVPLTARGMPDLSSVKLDGLQLNSKLQQEVEEAFAAEFPWHLIGIVGGIAGLGLLSLGLLALILA